MLQADLQKEVIALLPRLRRFARSLAENVSDADDLVQEGCALAIGRAHQFLPGRRLDSWMFAILRNEWISTRRKEVVRRGTGTVDAAKAPELQHSADGAAHLAASHMSPMQSWDCPQACPAYPSYQHRRLFLP
jgi:RNA polymerase sigma-70 factor, ECF subfamily